MLVGGAELEDRRRRDPRVRAEPGANASGRTGSGELLGPDGVVDVVAALATELGRVLEPEEAELAGAPVELTRELAGGLPLVDVRGDLGRDPARDRLAQLLVLVGERRQQRAVAAVANDACSYGLARHQLGRVLRAPRSRRCRAAEPGCRSARRTASGGCCGGRSGSAGIAHRIEHVRLSLEHLVGRRVVQALAGEPDQAEPKEVGEVGRQAVAVATCRRARRSSSGPARPPRSRRRAGARFERRPRAAGPRRQADAGCVPRRARARRGSGRRRDGSRPVRRARTSARAARNRGGAVLRRGSRPVLGLDQQAAETLPRARSRRAPAARSRRARSGRRERDRSPTRGPPRPPRPAVRLEARSRPSTPAVRSQAPAAIRARPGAASSATGRSGPRRPRLIRRSWWPLASIVAEPTWQIRRRTTAPDCCGFSATPRAQGC